MLTAAGTAVLAVGASATGMIVVGATFAPCGLVNGTGETVKQPLVGAATPEHQHVEAFSWSFSVLWLGLGLGLGLGATVAEQPAGDGETTPPLLAATAAQATGLALTSRVDG